MATNPGDWITESGLFPSVSFLLFLL